MATQGKTRGRSKSEQKRHQILLAATRLYLEQGIHATSMEQIAEEAEVSKQTLYSHFGGKEELFVAAIEQKCIQHELAPALFNDDLPPRQVLFDLATHLLELLLSEDAIKLHRLCISGVEQYPSICQLYWQAGPQNLIGLFQNYLERKVESGQLQINNTAFAAQQFLNMVKGDAYMKAILNIGDVPAIEDLYAYLDDVVDLFLNAYESSQSS